jgi:hypothetical protein
VALLAAGCAWARLVGVEVDMSKVFAWVCVVEVGCDKANWARTCQQRKSGGELLGVVVSEKAKITHGKD